MTNESHAHLAICHQHRLMGFAASRSYRRTANESPELPGSLSHCGTLNCLSQHRKALALSYWLEPWSRMQAEIKVNQTFAFYQSLQIPLTTLCPSFLILLSFSFSRFLQIVRSSHADRIFRFRDHGPRDGHKSC